MPSLLTPTCALWKQVPVSHISCSPSWPLHTPNQFRAVHGATVDVADVGVCVGAGIGRVVVTGGAVIVGSDVAADV